jgi:dTDP-4-dehydrorhamnose reductase
MRILVLGGTGMLGHKMHEVLAADHDVTSTTRSNLSDLPVKADEFFHRGSVVEGVDATDLDRIGELQVDRGSQAIINCVGVVKQRPEADDPQTAIAINALLPHRLAALCRARSIGRVHFSTDCVFSGARGDYREDDPTDAVDLYGRTKAMGEVQGPGALTIRSSLIGRELARFGSLVEWFLQQRGEVRGYTRAFFSGLTTTAMAEVVRQILEEHPSLSGVYHVASPRISKFELLQKLRERLELQAVLDVVPDDTVAIDRSLHGERFEAATGIRAPGWDEMLEGFPKDSARYRRMKP